MRWIAALLLLLVGRNRRRRRPSRKFTGLCGGRGRTFCRPRPEAELTTKLEALQKDTKRQLVVATIADLQGYPLEEYGYGSAARWGVGLRDVNNGADPVHRAEQAGQRVRIEVGTGWSRS